VIRNVLSIAGSDPSGGAGIQADLKTFSAFGAYGMAVLTALTAQNTQGVFGIHAVPAAFVADQIRAVFADIRVDAVKIGMIANAEIASAVADALAPYRHIAIVLDPVMVAKGGSPLLQPDAIEVMKQRLIPLAHIVTPNLPELAVLIGEKEAADREAMAKQTRTLRASGARAALVKGGHLPGPTSPDLLISDSATTWFDAPRIETTNTHGTGCTLSSAIAAELARGASLPKAVLAAKAYLSGAFASASLLAVGTGHGPVHHFHSQWPQGNGAFG